MSTAVDGKTVCGRTRLIFNVLAAAAVAVALCVGCVGEGKRNNPITSPDNSTPGGGGGSPEIFAVDISQETSEWNYMVVGNDESSMFIDVDESNDIPIRAFLKPDKNSDDGFTIFFKENGLPDKVVVDGHILYFGNFTGYKYDLAIIYPDNRIEYHFDIETDVNWDAYNADSGLSKAQFLNLDGLSKTLKIVSHAVGIGTCGVTLFFPNPVTGTMCASYVIGELRDSAVALAGRVFDGFPTDKVNLALDIFDCATLYYGDAWTSMLEMLGDAGAVGACLSVFTSTISIVSNQDFSLTEQKAEQINEAIRKIDGDVLTEIPRELLELFYDLGIIINSGRNPPNIEGTYLVPTLTVMRNTTGGSIAEQWDKYVTFFRQNDNRLTVNVDYTLPSASGPFSLSGLGYIVGDGNKYTIIVDGIREEDGYTAKTVEAFSGEITSTGINAYQWAVFMIDNSGDPLGHWISNGTGYSKSGTAVKFDPNQSGLANNPIPLTADIWTDDSITSGGLNEMWYTFNVVSGTSYNISWSDSYQGTGDHTLDILVSAQYENGTSIFSGVDNAYNTPKTFTANQTGIVKIKVYPYSSKKTGTYALTYRVLDPNQPGSANNPITLAADIWTAGSITSGGFNERWYSFNVVSGTSYRVWWSDSYDGSGDHTLDILVSAQYENGTSIFSGIDDAYNTPKTFTANQTGIVKIRAYPYSSGETGTYALTYSVFDPNQPGSANNPISLAADTWTAGSITSGGFNEMWYSFDVVSGTSYRVWWSDSYEGNGDHTLDILVSAQYENGTSIFSGVDDAYNTPKTFTANQTGIVKIRAYPYSSGNTGTYALTYSAGSAATRPLAKIATFSGKTFSVDKVHGVEKTSSKTVSFGARH